MLHISFSIRIIENIYVLFAQKSKDEKYLSLSAERLKADTETEIDKHISFILQIINKTMKNINTIPKEKNIHILK